MFQTIGVAAWSLRTLVCPILGYFYSDIYQDARLTCIAGV